jgi:hypothetical protein
MVDELAPLGLVDAARRLGTTPFDLVRVAVAAGEMPTGPMRFDAARLERIAAAGAFRPATPAPTATPQRKSAAEQAR